MQINSNNHESRGLSWIWIFKLYSKTEKTTKEQLNLSENERIQKSIFEAGEDQDFKELFPKLQLAEKEYNTSKKGGKKNS